MLIQTEVEAEYWRKHCVENSMVCLKSHGIIFQKQLGGKINQEELIEFSSIALWILVIMSH